MRFCRLGPVFHQVGTRTFSDSSPFSLVRTWAFSNSSQFFSISEIELLWPAFVFPQAWTWAFSNSFSFFSISEIELHGPGSILAQDWTLAFRTQARFSSSPGLTFSDFSPFFLMSALELLFSSSSNSSLSEVFYARYHPSYNSSYPCQFLHKIVKTVLTSWLVSHLDWFGYHNL